MNLKKMREDGIQEKLLEGVTDYLVVDQDLLNVVCYGAIRLLSPDYNCIPGVYAASPRILHFLMRDYLRPWKNRRAGNAALWWRCAEEFSHLTDTDRLREEANWYQRGSISYMARRCADYAGIYVRGSGPDAQRILRALRLGKVKGLQRLLPEDETVPCDPDTLVINASRKRDQPLPDTFPSHEGGKEHVISFSRWPVSFYNLLPRELEREVEAELLMWEFGADCRGLGSCTAMLEMNAARYPDREAVAVWRDGRRAGYTFRDLNRMANRMADRIRKQGIRRGTRVNIPSAKGCAAEMAAALLGIMKSGCVACLADEAELTADLTALTDTRYASSSPRIETLPDEPVLYTGGKVFTGRELCERAQQLRRRCGWHAQDRLLIAKQPGRGLIEWIAAFYYGNTVIAAPDETGAQLLEKIGTEKATLVTMDDTTFAETVRKPGWAIPAGAGPVTGDCRVVFTGDSLIKRHTAVPRETMRDAVRRWERIMPHIPVDGLGYDGGFLYDCRWY